MFCLFTFSEPVNCGSSAFSIGLDCNVEVNGTAETVGTLPTLSWAAISPNTDGSSTQWVVTFSGAGVNNGSIANGVYDITANSYASTSDANPDVFAQRASGVFYRLYGDINGDQTVGAADFVAFSNCYGESAGEPGYNAGFNQDGASTIDAADFVALSNDYGITFSGFTQTA